MVPYEAFGGVDHYGYQQQVERNRRGVGQRTCKRPLCSDIWSNETAVSGLVNPKRC